MWEEATLKCWSVSGSYDNLFDPLLGDTYNPLLWSPTSVSSSPSTSSSSASDLLSPEIYSQGRYFSFNEFDLCPQGSQNSISGQELYNYTDQPKIFNNTELSPLPSLSSGSLDLGNQLSPVDIGRIWSSSLNSIKVETNELNCESPGSLVNEMIDTDEENQLRRDSFSSSEGDEQEFQCLWIDCKVVFESQNSLVRHIDRFHVEGRKEDFRCFWHGCSRKNRPFNARYKLLIHMRVHTGHKPNQCKVSGCGKSFSRLENLKIHVRSHTGERPYVCHRCPKAFSNSSDRAKHQRTHIESKPYHCMFPNCNKKYTDPSSLRKHAKIHFLQNLNVKDMFLLQAYESGNELRPAPKRRKIVSAKQNPATKFLPMFSSIKQSMGHELAGKNESFELMDTDVDPFFESKGENNLLVNTDWMASEELKDIEQILSF